MILRIPKHWRVQNTPPEDTDVTWLNATPVKSSLSTSLIFEESVNVINEVDDGFTLVEVENDTPTFNNFDTAEESWVETARIDCYPVKLSSNLRWKSPETSSYKLWVEGPSRASSICTNSYKLHCETATSNTIDKWKIEGAPFTHLATNGSNIFIDLYDVTGDVTISYVEASLTPGMYRTGAIALYEEQGASAVEDMLIRTWDDMITSGDVIVKDGVVSWGYSGESTLGELNEYGFIYDCVYYGTFNGMTMGLSFAEDGSLNMYSGGSVVQSAPAGTATYEYRAISALGDMLTVSEDGHSIVLQDVTFSAASGIPFTPEQDLVFPNDGSVVELPSFMSSTTVTGVVIPDAVKSFNSNNFAMSTINTVLISPESELETIGSTTFAQSQIKKIRIPSKIISIGSSAFNGCAELEQLEVDGYPTSIGSYVFKGCNKLKSVGNLLTNVTVIPIEAFKDCSSLDEITLNKNLNKIDTYAFSNCSSLTSIDIPFYVESIPNYAFSHCSALTTVRFARGAKLTYIGSQAFYNTNITEISLPNKFYNYRFEPFGGKTPTMKKMIFRNKAGANSQNYDDGGTSYKIANTDSTTIIYMPYTSINNFNNVFDGTISKYNGYTPASFESYHYDYIIDDTWDEIAAHVADGTYKTRYSINQVKTVDMGDEGIIRMRLVAMDTDDKSDGSGKAALTWIALDSVVTVADGQELNGGNVAPSCIRWDTSTFRTGVCQQTLWNSIPENVRKHIVAVDKQYSYVDRRISDSTTYTGVCSDSLWAPSIDEIKGVIYPEGYTSTEEAAAVNKPVTCLLRDSAITTNQAYSKTLYFKEILSDGTTFENSMGVGGYNGILIGFCM